MIYLYIGKNTIKLLSLSKTFLSQYNVAYFNKVHENNLLDEGKVKNVDILASALKEAITMAQPKAVVDTSVTLILPQEAFEFVGYDIPVDISETAIPPFIRDKARAELKLNLEESLYDYLLVKKENKAKVLFFSQEKNTYQSYEQVFQLLGLKLENVIPETLSFFKLFEKTLRAEKKETILYVNYTEKKSFGYLFNSYGLLSKQKYQFTEDIKESLKSRIEKLDKENLKPNRIILSGPLSETVRQDLFTKDVGVWTNPLKKIILDFYQDYLKLIIIDQKETFPLLDFAVCLGAFVFQSENSTFKLSCDYSTNQGKKRLPSLKIVLPVSRRDIVIFVVSFLITFLLIYSFPYLKNLLPKNDIVEKKSPTTPVIETKTPTPTPSPTVDKKTLKIKVLNGTGIKGLAGEVKELLLEKGYSEILTGNAELFNVENTQIQIKDDKKMALNLFLDNIKDRVAIDKKNISKLSEDDSADIILIIGNDFE